MKQFIIILFAALSLTGCKLYTNYERPEGIKTDSLYRTPGQEYAVLEGDTASFGNMPWREVFTEPQLQTLIEKALVQNSNIRQADLNIQKAEQGLRVSRLAYFPTVAISPQGTVSSWDFSKASQIYNLPLALQWEIDIFGKLRNAKKQSEMTVEQVKVYKQATQTAIIAAVAQCYYSLQMLDAQLATTRATLDIWRKNVRTMEAMKDCGMVNEASVSAARANLLGVEASVPTLEKNITSLENSLSNLLNEAPHGIARGTFSAEGFPAELSAGVPVQLLSARPDVRAAELQLARAFYGVNAARAAFYPSITISGQGAWTNSGGMGIVNPGKILAAAVASLTQPLFAQGKLRANLAIAKTEQESAQIAFQDALFKAGQEVSDALASYSAAQDIIAKREVYVKELEHTAETTKILFQNGNTTTYLETLTAEMNLLNARLALISCKYDKVQAVISLYQALGGGRE